MSIVIGDSRRVWYTCLNHIANRVKMNRSNEGIQTGNRIAMLSSHKHNDSLRDMSSRLEPRRKITDSNEKDKVTM